MTTQFDSKVMQKLCEVEERVVNELIDLTGFSFRAHDLKKPAGARYAIGTINEKGYFITQTNLPGSLEVSYILQRHGTIIAQRNVSVEIKVKQEIEADGEK